MFDVGFFEIIVIVLVALVVLGPERLPGAIRTVGLWAGRLKQRYAVMKSEFEREIGADEIRQQLHNEEVMRSLKASKEDMQRLQQEFQRSQAKLEEELKESP